MKWRQSSLMFVTAFIVVVTASVSGTKLPPGGLEWKNCTRPNEFYDCGSACQNECATLGKPCPIATFRCVDDCFCVHGYARNLQGTCIPEKEC